MCLIPYETVVGIAQLMFGRPLLPSDRLYRRTNATVRQNSFDEIIVQSTFMKTVNNIVSTCGNSSREYCWRATWKLYGAIIPKWRGA